jgi:SpoVK/Ycf46/Vps4 family AAA+-type ATPase
MLHRPLYSVSIGQLGTTPAELESKLGEILDLCSRWDALILLDEADLFLEKRTHGGSLERNAMVSVMLRLVEYFKGVLFLTSNRVDSLDPAFKTRITLALNYEPLDEAAREQVWRNLLEASGQVAVLEQGLIHTQALAQYKLNGREIKNSIRLALSLAAEDGISLSQACLLETVEMLCHVNENLESSAPY